MMMIKCPHCGTKNPLINKDCLACGMSLGFPNVNECSQKEELKALGKRYKKKIESARDKGHQNKIAEFEEEIKKSLAVINVDLEYLHSLIVRGAAYSNYQLLTTGEARDFARPEADKERLGVEGTIFGSYGRNIRYAALSLDGSGLKSYGDFTIILSNKAVGLRATLLEENSYKFVKRHKILAGGKIPKGYRAVWKDKHKLAVAKLIKKALLTKKENYAIIVLKDTGNRKKDDFIEVHIYGRISKESLQAVRGNSKDAAEKVKIEKIKEYLKNNNKEWIEE